MKAMATLALLALGGCGSILNLGEGPQVYGGIRHDVRWMNDGSLDMTPVYDLPCSAILDTALLPITLIFEGIRCATGWPPPTGSQVLTK